ncbi:inositol monophosphatase [Desulfovibrio aminophilus]|nr:inositol monophosphatase family protein [Desulfovibrio aminophilus]MCM0754375.1 inositol monophosphatase [Desulfovibrio aminophilus]
MSVPFAAEAILARAAGAVREAGAIITANFGHPGEVRRKGRIDLVTSTDLAVEALLKERLAAILPGSDFLAEESSSKAGLGELTWIIDPLDGTTNFAHGLPFVATSVALWRGDHVALGLVNLPVLGELYTAIRGGGAWRDGERIRVSAVDRLEDSLIATGFPYDNARYLDEIALHLRRVLSRTQGLRRPGAAALDLAYVACGRYDGFYECALNAWDTAAGVLLVEEAGGRVSGYDARRPYRLGGERILASNGLLHEDLSSLLTEPAAS